MKCECCGQQLPKTKLDQWMARNNYSYRTLGEKMGVPYDLIYRLNHQPPNHRHCANALNIQARLLDLTGLRQPDLCNELPRGGYAYGKENSEQLKAARERRLAEVAAKDALDERVDTSEPAVAELAERVILLDQAF